MESQSQEETGRDDTARPSPLSSLTCGLFNSPSSSAEAGSSASAEARVSTPQQNVPRVFTFKDLSTATRNFCRDNVLGQGGFGIVFLGWIEEHGTAPAKQGTGLPVAVKVLHPTWLLPGRGAWLAEVNGLWELRHPNLVKLIGQCSEGQDRVLVYEYMELRSLQDVLSRPYTSPLSWRLRVKIALGAAKGLAYLHGEKISFGDFKTSNILLDSDYNAKLSDFGGLPWSRRFDSPRVMGTLGYLAPEYSLTGRLTHASDIYAFGVVLLELVTGRQAFDKRRTRGKESLAEMARSACLSVERNTASQLVDPNLSSDFSPEGAFRALCVASNCILSPRTRPTMQKVVEYLGQIENFTETASSAFVRPRMRPPSTKETRMRQYSRMR